SLGAKEATSVQVATSPGSKDTGPLLQTSDGKEMEEGTIRYLVQPRGPRSGPGPWQGGRRKFRRQRPRLSHKGPMPF
ncbi:PREDICTED: apelin, partial [Bison bison bison]|uniref:Apelin n=1 Tax=Bison bison bison TaxID=43346 RepID=A0A6P3GHG1_BISBB